MSKELEELLANGRAAIALERKLEAEKLEAERVFEEEQAGRKLGMAIKLIPEALVPFARIDESNELVIELPDGAKVAHTIYFGVNWDGKRNSIAEVSLYSRRFWDVYAWCVDDGEVHHAPQASVEDVTHALIMAQELLYTKAEAEAKAAELLHAREMQELVALDNELDNPQICPLLAAGDGDLMYCKREDCAWWNNRQKQCAVITLVQ